MNSCVRQYVSRYVVPFYFDIENRGYEVLRKHFLSNTIDNQALGLPKDGQWVNAGFWENYKSDRNTQAEMDLYSFLPSIFLEDKNTSEKDISNLGVSFVYKTSGRLLELKWKYKDKSIEFDCRELGILLLRNGIGFIWYETGFKGEVSLDEYVGFQHDFKELARTHDQRVLRKIGFDKEKREDIDESFCLGEWLSGVVAADNLGIRFWAERETKRENGDKARIPDKALMFQYLFIDRTTDQERDNLVFRIANAYDEKYNAPADIAESFYKPFGNTCFYVSKAGMACVVVNADSNEVFFEGQFREKYIRDYFFIYMLLSYQSFSCAYYSWLLTELPADEKLFNKKPKYYEKLESLNGQINLFLVKSVFESVSNIHHQNGVYRYGKASLCIEEDIQSLTVGLDALEDMEKEKRDRKVDKAMALFGVIVVISAVLDGLNLVDRFMAEDKSMNCVHWVAVIVIIILTIYMIYTLLKNQNR